MKKLSLSSAIIAILFSGFISQQVYAASSRLIWTTIDYTTSTVVYELIIEDGGEYEVPFGEEKEIIATSDLAEFGAVGTLYFIDPVTSQRELITDVGGESGIDELAWEKAGEYEFDFYLDENSFPTKAPWYKSWFASIFGQVVYAFDEAFFIETIRFTINDEGPEITPVVIIPGIMGSAYKNGQLVIDPILHTYDDLIATLLANGYEEGVDLFTFPYEWRNSNVSTAHLLDVKIAVVKAICGCNKVDIVAHSMGGLVARSYIQSVDYDYDIDRLVFLGVPHQGAPTAYLQWEAGKFAPDFNSVLRESFFVAQALRNGYLTVFDYIRNKPILSLQELLPIFDYIKDRGLSSLREYPSGYPRNTFLENMNNNISTLLNSGVNITNIVGSVGNETIERIRVITTTNSLFWEHGEPEGFGALIGDSGLERGVGDNTVPNLSSFMHGVVSELISASHNRIPTVSENRVFNILTGDTSVSNIDNGFNISPTILLLQLLSPIDFVVTDPDGNRMGKNFQTGGEYNEIPFAFYSGYKTNDEYITILNPLDGEYKIELQGMGSGGKYEVLTSYITDAFATTAEVTGITAPNQVTNLSVDIDNSDPENLESEREVTLDVIIADINGAYDLGWITDKKVRDSLIQQAKLIIKFEKKRNGKFEPKVDKILLKLLEKELDLLLKKGKINSEAYDLLKEDLKYLIDNN